MSEIVYQKCLISGNEGISFNLDTEIETLTKEENCALSEVSNLDKNKNKQANLHLTCDT